MAGSWYSLKTSFSLTFFGSSPSSTFDFENRSLHYNFVTMCSIAFPKTNSAATENLIEKLKQHKVFPYERGQKKEINKLDEALKAIFKWLDDRRDYSRRYNQVNTFYKTLLERRNQVADTYNMPHRRYDLTLSDGEYEFGF